jgi:hypothetical protein
MLILIILLILLRSELNKDHSLFFLDQYPHSASCTLSLIRASNEPTKSFSAPISRDEDAPKVLSLYKPKATFSAGNFIDPRMEMMSEGEGVDRINNEYIHKVRKVTIDVQKWVDKTLDDPVDLNEYIQVNIHGMEKKTEKIDPGQIEAAKTISNNFRSELEMALTSWKPRFLNKKKGRC